MTIPTRPRRPWLRIAPVAVVTGVVASVLLSLSLTGTLSAFTASIANPSNTAATGTVIMEEKNAGGTVTCLSTDGGSVSTNAASCSSINKFGGSTTMVPGVPVATTVTIKNTGTAAVSTFRLTPGGSCTQGTNGTGNGTATDLCARMKLTVASGATTVFTGTLASFATSPATAMTMPAAPTAGGAAVPFTFTVTLDETAPNQNTYQGLSASVPMTWSFSAGV